MEPWTDEQVCAQWLFEIEARFEAENAAWLREERAQIDAILAGVGTWDPSWGPRDSFLYEMYQGMEFRFRHNSVKIAFPLGFAVDGRVIELLDHTSVAWGFLILRVDEDFPGQVVGEITLVDHWDNAKAHAQLIYAALQNSQTG